MAKGKRFKKREKQNKRSLRIEKTETTVNVEKTSNTEKNKRCFKIEKNKKLFILKVILIIIFILCVIFSAFKIIEYVRNKKANQYAKDLIENATSVVEKNEDSESRIDKVKILKGENPDIVGWLEIPNTNISYPVLQGTDNSYYMYHNYKKEKSNDGSLFLDKAYDWNKPSTNLLIYGHNNRGSEEMFVGLLDYKNEEFYKNHTKIRFTTENEDVEYEIISIFLSRVYYQHEEDVFRYYYFVDAKNEEEFDIFINNCKKVTMHNIETEAEYGDSLITLSTCEYSQEDGRFAVVAKKIEDKTTDKTSAE